MNSRTDSQFRRGPLIEIQHVVSDLLHSEEYQETAEECNTRFADQSEPLPAEGEATELEGMQPHGLDFWFPETHSEM